QGLAQSDRKSSGRMARTARISPPAFRRLSPERFTVSPFHGNGEPLYLFVLTQFLELLWRPVTA
ncbi:hypothetical protein, partial [Mesorhizobium sp. M2A.F.Ca.ET.029.05.1.1]|uniref:hypothetical protein n=1 Tax=Mesorhizobium sp. M2A.F.Ca.ET.029.05.1.1 TaxID=2496658 RepID=UPI001AECD899